MFFFIFFEGNMFLDYFALGVLIFVFLVIFYGIIILHDIPYLIAKKRVMTPTY
ncbi:DUF3302 domain-containing protein [Escherichia coli]|nr:DUF3302 domain-containing protein [Escherichia coli]